jgi:hypothetical protein
MSLLAEYLTEEELATELRSKTGKGSRRMLRSWRAQRKGPAWAQLGIKIIYPIDSIKSWLRDQVQQPIRSRKRAA